MGGSRTETAASTTYPSAEGIQIACERIARFREMRGVAGVHIMAIEWEHKEPEIAKRAGLLPRPTIHCAAGN